ncbi:MAG: CPBP family intramembrane metalloprotease [Coriobacteriaceae bacterium]|uniref:CPBP family intramembrane glutamic endopeptidase n=1 Tax=Tractidigestivibacter sp. TaxID=2847320 RepID=UPI002A823712|nr:CPBP family intramembrane glutamic endopeptidase [Tractidigestivibacter sp.]MCI6274635.1 CPBP family intramembrane metalloprotease [Coriobacteriaceae bacterium]MCI6843287.1 CPBP family intramembrane metalloprotease [Coriobacteriaceae bacterium]MCI7439225.1 CPBP family intramembrane metalloprotease [Coriobacteriaceae bacterium]MDD7584830.1 CPBP family intramembrane metalloprotease [Coriobacteriaceae bacterium]MDY4535216.1 CPBP family intramembrane glutamic endopeptidase [Tractidigestivibacte
MDKRVTPAAAARLAGNYVWVMGMVFLGQVLGGLISSVVTVASYGVLAGGETDAMILALKTDSAAPLGITGQSASAASALYSACPYLMFVGIWIVALVYLRFSRRSRPVLRAVGTFTRGNTAGNLALGLLVGLVLNGVCALIAVATGSVSLSLVGVNVGGLVLLAVTVFVQSSAEELLCRCYLYQKTLRTSGSPVVAVVASSLLFGVLHLLNTGVTALSIVNIVLVGVLFGLMVWRLDSPWMAFAAHASWNFMQNVLLGLPNSGHVIPFALFGIAPGTTPAAGVAYDPVFGIEGSVAAALALLAGCAFVWWLGERRNVAATDVWGEAADPDAS